MSSAPANLPGSILQTPVVQHHAAGIRNTEETQRFNASRRRAAAIDQQDTTVSTDDEDTQIHPDTHGTGGQGRDFSGGEEETEQPPAENSSLDSLGDEGRHLDLTA